MIARSFLDSNVVLYTDDPRDPAKQAIAAMICEASMASGFGVVSTQVLQEYFSIATSKLRVPLELARRKVELTARLNVVQVDPALILAGIDLHRLHQFSFWDALIVAAAQAGGCAELLSEDMQHGRQIGGVRIVNPFLPT